MPAIEKTLSVVIILLFPKQPLNVDGYIQKTQACLRLLFSSFASARMRGNTVSSELG